MASLLASAPAIASVYYVSPTGNDTTGDGSKSNPWKTPHKAKTIPLAGDTVYFRGGDYIITKFVYLNKNGGTATAPITYASYPGETARFVYDGLTYPSGTGENEIIFVEKPYIVLERLVLYQSPASRSVFINRAAPALAAATGLHGIQIFAPDVTVRKCVIDNVSGTGIKSTSKRTLVEENVVKGQFEHGFYFGGEAGIWRNNHIDGSKGYSNAQGIQIQWSGTVANKIYGNVVINGAASGVVFSGAVSNNEVFNNVFINCGTGSGAFGVVLNYWHQDGVIGPGNKFFNNTIMGKPPHSGLIHSIDGKNVDTFNNVFRMSSPVKVGGAQGFQIHDNLFFNATNVPLGNLTGDPKLANPQGTDAAAAKLLAGSLAINKAATGSPTNDFFGTRRPQGGASDLGASEFVSGNTVVPVPPSEFQLR